MSHTNYIKSLIVLLTTLILTTLVSVNSQAETCTTNDLGDRTCTTSTAGTTTGNVLTNSTFTPDGSGNYLQGWTTSGDIGNGHPSTSGTTYTGQNTSGYLLAFEGDRKSVLEGKSVLFRSSGNYLQGWTTSGDIGNGHPSTSGTTYTGQNTSG